MARIEETMLSSVNFLFNLFIFKVFFSILSFGRLALRRFDAHEVFGDLVSRTLRQNS